MVELIIPEWQAPDNVVAVCTTRSGGVSQEPFDSLNLGLHVGDNAEQVVENRRRLRMHLNLSREPEWIRQTHSNHCVVLERDSDRDADAAITCEPGRVAVVMTADCLPILLCQHDGAEVAAVHAGWRGLQAGIVQNTLATMQSKPDALMAWIGPAISQPCYEVGEEVLLAFDETMPDASDCFQASRPGHWFCDLAGLAEKVLKRAGVDSVTRSSDCSYRDKERLFSYRREPVTGRMASLIWIK